MMVSKVTDAQGVERTVGANVWVKLLGEWSDRLTRTSKTVLDAGIEERQTTILEHQASLIADMTYGMLTDLGVEMNEDNMAIIR
jgi:hypothetical protein